MYVKSHVSCGDSAREKKSRVASVNNIHTTCSQLLDRYNYQCCFSLLLCAGGSEAWFQTRDYPVFDQVAFLQGPEKERRVERNHRLVFMCQRQYAKNTERARATCEQQKGYFGRYHSCTIFHV